MQFHIVNADLSGCNQGIQFWICQDVAHIRFDNITESVRIFFKQRSYRIVNAQEIGLNRRSLQVRFGIDRSHLDARYRRLGVTFQKHPRRRHNDIVIRKTVSVSICQDSGFGSDKITRLRNRTKRSIKEHRHIRIHDIGIGRSDFRIFC